MCGNAQANQIGNCVCQWKYVLFFANDSDFVTSLMLPSAFIDITFNTTGGVSDGESCTVSAQSDHIWGPGEATEGKHILHSLCEGTWKNPLARRRSRRLLHL